MELEHGNLHSSFVEVIILKANIHFLSLSLSLKKIIIIIIINLQELSIVFFPFHVYIKKKNHYTTQSLLIRLHHSLYLTYASVTSLPFRTREYFVSEAASTPLPPWIHVEYWKSVVMNGGLDAAMKTSVWGWWVVMRGDCWMCCEGKEGRGSVSVRGKDEVMGKGCVVRGMRWG